MRKALFAVLTLSTLALPGCIFAIGSGRDDWDDDFVSSDCCSNCQQMQHVQNRLSVLEHHAKGDCKAECPLCKAAATPAAKAETKPDAKAEAKPAAK